MPISTSASTLRLMLRLALAATAHSVAGKCSEMYGNGRRPTSNRFLDLPPTPTQIIRSRGLEDERYCVAGAGQPAPGSPGPSTGIFFHPTAMTSFPDFGPAPFSTEQGLGCGVRLRIGERGSSSAPSSSISSQSGRPPWSRTKAPVAVAGVAPACRLRLRTRLYLHIECAAPRGSLFRAKGFFGRTRYVTRQDMEFCSATGGSAV